MEFIDYFLKALNTRIYFLYLAIATVVYYAIARVGQNFLYSWRPPFHGFVQDARFFDYYLKPEPYELWLYLAGYIVIPLFALGLFFLSRIFFHRRAAKYILFAASVIVAAILVSRIRSLPIPNVGFYTDYFRTHALSHTIWLLFTKRMFFLRIAALFAVCIFFFLFLWPQNPFGAWIEQYNNTRFLRRIAPFALLLMLFIIFNPNLPYDEHHYNYMIGPANETVQGKPLLYETPTQYGIFSIYIIAALLRKAGPHIYNAFSLVVFFSYAIYYIALYVFVRKWLRSYLFAYFGIATVIAVTYFLQVSPTLSAFHFPGLSPFRIGLYVIVLYLLLLFSRTNSAKKRARIRYIAICMAGIAPFWIFDAGTYLAAATVLTFSALLLAERELSLRRKIYGLAVLATFAAFIVCAIFLSVSVGNYLIHGEWPHWMLIIKEVDQFGKGIAMFPLPIVGFFEVYVFVYLAMLLIIMRRMRDGERIDPVLLFLTLYGIFSFQYYIGTSSWTLLYHIAPPLILILLKFFYDFFQRKKKPLWWQRNKLSRTIASAFGAALFSVAFIFAAKVPVEFAHRNYRLFPSSLYTIRSSDEDLYFDAHFIKTNYGGGQRLAFLHPRTTKLAAFTEKANLFNFFTLDQMFRKSQAFAALDTIERERPLYIFLGKGDNNRLIFFRSQLPRYHYQKVESLRTLDVYQLKEEI